MGRRPDSAKDDCAGLPCAMLKRIQFPPFTPDLPLTTADVANVIATPQGYRPAKAFSAVTAALPGILGGGSFVGSDGTSVLLGGDATDLYTYASGSWTSEIGSLTAGSWRFAQFNDEAIAVYGGTPVSYDIAGGTAAAISGAPSGDMIATVRNQIFLAGDSNARNTLYISGYNDSAGWTPGTNQALDVPFPSGGEITGLAGGETGIILQQRSVKRAIYTGDVTVWQFDEISRDIGCMAKGSVAQAGQLVFFLSDQGFKVCDRNEVIAIGYEAVDRTFFASYERADIVDRITAAVDPRETIVSWSMPGTPGRLWQYNWSLGPQKGWSVIETDIAGVFPGFSYSLALEDLDALYPSGIDSIPLSLDSTMFAGGHPLFFVINAAGEIGTLTGSNLAAFVSIPPVEIEPGMRVRVRGVRFVSDATAGAATIDQRARAGDAVSKRTSGSIRDNGRVPIRANGRHLGLRADIPAGEVWTYLHGADLEYEVEGVR